jgi:putative flippase GtrA
VSREAGTVVGAIGTAINMLVLYLFSQGAGLPLAAASALAVELPMVSNYLLNDSWTFAARTPTFRRFAKFDVASLMGLALNTPCPSPMPRPCSASSFR